MLGLIGLLECYNTYDQDDIYFNIAELILKNYKDLNVSNIQEFASSIHISVSTAQRFVKQLYYENFPSFRNGYNKFSESYQYDGKYFEGQRERAISPVEYGKIISEGIERAMTSLDENLVQTLVEIIKDSDEVIFVGIPMTSEVWRLQVELILMGKRTSAFIDPNYQIKAVGNSNEKSLVICIQCMRQDDNHNEHLLRDAKEQGAKIGYISHVKKKSVEDIIDIGLVYKGNNTQTDSISLGIILNYIGSQLSNMIEG